ncbi:MAG TPA: molybdenum cofactor guanylyltransferase [Candidatus Udaeobacter sp.]|nr:molybdenum cofactor guanylyltransferase [Candidatus Udaeobacter sp.]
MPRDSSTPLRSARNDFSAVLLAGGESRRMGVDKATFLFRAKPLWQVQIETLRKLRPAEIFVSARTDPSWRPDDVQFIADSPPSCGPLSGLAASLVKIHTAHLLALAIDMPFMTENYLLSMCDAIEPGRGVVAKIDNRAEPLAAVYPREAEIDFRIALEGTDLSLQNIVRHLLRSGKLLEISVTKQERGLFRNVNNASDVDATIVAG